MVMEKIFLAVCALLAFLLPIGFYSLILASINRRSKPLLVGGVWDTIGLLFAMSGFFLITMPMLLSEFIARAFTFDGVITVDTWIQHWMLFLAYLLLLICGSAFIILWRGGKTMIYNVDADQFPKALERALASAGLTARLDRAHLVLTSAATENTESTAFSETPAKPVAVMSDDRHAELEIETFASMCHVTLHWEKAAPAVREQIEKELNRNLESAAPLENAAAGWFLNISGMIFGTLVMMVLTFVALIILLRR